MTVAEVSLKGRFHSQCHLDDVELLIKFCDSHRVFQFPDASKLALPIRLNSTGDHIDSRKLHEIALRSILVDQCKWYQLFLELQFSRLAENESLIACFGPERCVPSSLMRRLSSQLIHVADLDLAINRLSTTIREHEDSLRSEDLPDDRIAVVGMSCLVPGAADVEEFWQLLCNGKSQHIEVPEDRFSFETAWRDSDPKRKWYGNFIQDYDTFDHKFFKKSPREMASTDPQHRLILQVAYQAVEQSGYFRVPKKDKHIGCYMGVGLVDYENNIACYPANAYSATGNLKSFAAGRISHYFGWTGPGLTIDTACSSSAVAVHQACRAILSGECSAALASGVNLMTSPEWFQNLAGASFLSPTGQCKPFDAKADGYCRGEGVGAVFLKRLSSAISDNDQVLGVIASTAVYQNQNCTAITVPNMVSLSDLFSNVTKQAKLEPKQISVVEAHGTGTPVGDPAEYDSVRNVFGRSARSDTLSLGSVKGLVGHTESASGIVALLKILLMVQKGLIPPQPSFDTINPAIKASSSDNIEVVTKLKPWDVGFRAALINNYGASGSNASLVVTQAPNRHPNVEHNACTVLPDTRHPFWLCGFDDQSLRRYSAKFRQFLQLESMTAESPSIANLAFQVFRQSNRSLGQALIFSCSTAEELKEKLEAFEQGEKSMLSTVRQPPRPTVLCFGGQVSTFIGLDRKVYERVKILRNHLDQCNIICQSIGLDGIYPEIFQKNPVTDIVKLQTMLFAIQYSCAMSWIDCGVQVAAVVGHSFGELTALCVSGALSLGDTIRMIAGRARLIQDNWAPEKGSMIAIEADQDLVQKLLSDSSEACKSEPAATIACFNGPTSFTIAGSTQAIETIADLIASEAAFSSSMKARKLNVTNAFHSSLVDPLMEDLERLGQDLEFKEPVISLERATESAVTSKLTPRFVRDHMRNPVYFNHAVQRLSERYGSCIWLEAGSNSTITAMASRALRSPRSSHFQPINITSDNALQFLADATTSLWKEGLNMSFWLHHPTQTSEYNPLLLPPYQFEKSRHWMELKKPQKSLAQPAAQSQTQEEIPKGLWTFIGFQDENQQSVRFRVNTMTKKFGDYLTGHIVAQAAPLCSSVVQLEIAIDALISLCPRFENSNLQPQLQLLESHGPMSLDPSRYVWLDAITNDANSLVWDFKMISHTAENTSASSLHVSGKVIFQSADDPKLHSDFAKYERLVGINRCQRLLDGSDAEEVIQGRNIYKAFADIVQYSQTYKGLQKIASKGLESAGRVVKKRSNETWVDTGLFDSFCQVAGIFVNCMTDRSESDMYISDRIEQWIRSPKLRATSVWPETFDVFTCHHRPSEKEYISDVFVFDPCNGALLEVILGIHYQRISKDVMRKVLSRVAPAAKTSIPATPSISVQIEAPRVGEPPLSASTIKPAQTPIQKAKKKSSRPDISPSVKNLVSNLSGLEPDEIKDETGLGDMGIDSLMGMELAREIEIALKCTLDTSELNDLTDFASLIKCIQNALGLPNTDEMAEDEGDSEQSAEEDKATVNGQIPNAVEQSQQATTRAPYVNGTTHVNSIPYTNGVVHTNGVTPHANGVSPSASIDKFGLSTTAVLEAFSETKRDTDQFIVNYNLGNYVNHVLPKSTELCIVHILDAFDELGCSIRNAKPGQRLERIQHLAKHEQYVEFLYDLLEKTARLIDIDGSQITRTAISAPAKSAEFLLQDLLQTSPDHAYDHKLTYLTGAKLAECLTGKSDALQLIFGTAEGREIASGMYSKSPINLAWIKQMEGFLRHLLSNIPLDAGPIKILEMGAGTGGTTSVIAPIFASLDIPIEYTVTDISSSLVAGARKRFKQYSFMNFKVFDIEKPPTAEMLHSQHIIIATNCVHATHSLVDSTKNIHDVLRHDGFLMMLEMTETLPWVDLIFGLIEGWWLFNDGRQHALAHPSVWEKTLQQVGYGHVDWTEGNRPEADVQRIIIALASGPRYDRVPKIPKSTQSQTADFAARQAVVDSYIKKYTQGFSMPTPLVEVGKADPSDQSVLVTGATGSLGSHLVAHLASLPSVKKIYCLNRYSSIEAELRQHQALKTRGLSLEQSALSKIRAYQADAAKPILGLQSSEYEDLAQSITHIIHNAWPMSITRPINAFESQFKVMQNLIRLACEASSNGQHGSRITFQFISSIATVGYYPLWRGTTCVPEERMSVNSVLPTGYGDAKLVCERMLDETLHKYPHQFRPMAVRIGQIAGSNTSGYWNPIEHFAFLIKSSQTLKALPDFEGELSWCPVNDVSAALSELLISDVTPYPIYHIENPARQSWRDMISILGGTLNVPRTNVVPFHAWIRLVRQFPGSTDIDNPAAKLVDFLEEHFVRMSCGGLILDTTRSREHSKTLASEKVISAELVRSYISAWKAMGFLN
ncbi:non-reducing polyketide synthase 1 [Glonium stellatum]|uniref:Non-reducing polyketide synthase 1 n=1 Tax=Glonium stellatum TaxID=574774 RepID=A0A8E2JXV5_9PEZI|nr:non-reducing polyketide synthase 1 [Glonium stellatum]